LRSIRDQDYPSLEIIVVDNESTDETPEIAARYADQVLSSPGPLGRVRQTSTDAATGEVLAIFDDDIVIPHRNWLRNAVALFDSDERISTVWPRLVVPPGASIITRCFFELNDAIFADRMATGRGVFGGGNSLFRRSAFEAVGGFDTRVDFGEDMVLAARLKAAGFSVAYNGDPLIHDSMYSLREIYRKQLWGATAIATSGWELMEQGGRSLIHEQVVVGLRGMIRGLLAGRLEWLAFPVLLAAKAAAYARVFFQTKRGDT
jgi:glycosyltransferase involved in cell wall biosynthesis